jgi:hypothetical protein
MIGAIILKDISTTFSHQGHNKAPSGHQLQEAEEEEALMEGSAPNREGCFVYSIEKKKGHTIRTFQVTIQKQKEIAEAEA